MESDEFFEEIDQEVFVANADKINVYVRYADTSQGSTTPNGATTFKVEVSSNVSCVTSTAYGFHHWAAFSTVNFNINGQNPEIIYVSDNDEYLNGAGKNELSEDVVTFGNRHSESTSVIIHQNRSDIVLVPVVAVRPAVDRSSPANNATNVVRNTSIRYIFTKKMDLSSFTKDTVKITSGFAVLTDLDIASTDITDRYIWGNPATDESYSPMISASGKLVTFRLRNGSENYLDSNQQITITFSPEIKDVDGYMEGVQQKFYFITGTSIDALAPVLNQVKGGINGKFKDFESAEKANSDTIKTTPLENTYFDSYLPQRVKDYVNIYVHAADIGGEGTGVSVADADENAVIYYGTRARLIYDSNGEAVDSSAAENIIEAKQQAYVPNGNYIADATDATGGYGCAFRYDLGSLPDGLIEIDIWAVDSVGNSGLDEPYYGTYDNGYRALLVVKDTTPPVPNVTTISARSSSAIYGWYNESTLGETNLYKTAAIVDYGHPRLRAVEDAIKWIFTVGDNAAAWGPAAYDSSWRLVTVGDYALSGITAQNEGAVGILMALMDDMGNVSTSAPLGNAVMFDRTKPAISSLTWVNSSGVPVLGVASGDSLDNYLKIDFTEEMSGVREIILEVNGASGIDSGTQFYTSIDGAPISYTVGTRNGKQCVIFGKPADADGYKTGSIFVKGIKLGSGLADGNYTVSAALCDAALNASAVVNKQLGIDKTPPVLEKIVIPLIKRIQQFGEAIWRYFVGKDACINNSIPVQLHIAEKGSGIKVIDFSGGDIKPSASSTIKMTVGGVTKNVTDFTVSDGVITFGDNLLYEISNENKFVLEINGCQFTHIKSASHTIGENIISIKLTDFAGLNSGTPLNQITHDVSGDTYTKVIANALPAATPTIALVDRGTNASGTADLIPAQTGFTNYEVVNGTVTVPVSGSTNDFVELKLTGGATFADDMAITAKEVGGSSIAIAGEYSFSADKKSIVFTKAFSADKYADGIEFTIENIELPSGDGAKTVAMQTLASSSLASSNGSANITLDTKAPLTRGACSYTTQEKYYPKTVDVVTPTYGKELTSGGIPYFYANDATRQFDIINKETSGTYYKVDANDYFIKISTTKTSASDIYNDGSAITTFNNDTKTQIKVDAQDPASAQPYSYIIYDVAGNYSEVKQFYLIKDEAAQVIADNKIAAHDSATAHFFKNAPSGGTRTYVMKQATNEYKIVVNLSDYAEKLTNATHSGLAQWAITSDGANPTSWQNYDSTQNSGNIEYFINSVTEEKKLTLCLKDNCGNTTKIDIKDDDGYTNTILWTIDSTAPVIAKAKGNSKRTDLTTGALGSGPWFRRTYIDGDNNYYNSKSMLGITYNQETCLFDAEDASEGTALAEYTVRARLYSKVDSAMPTYTEIINASESLGDVSKWCYFKDTNSMTARTFYIPYPTNCNGRYMFLLLEDTVGNQRITQIKNQTASVYYYVNEPPVIRINGGATPTTSTNLTETFIPASATESEWGTVKYYEHLNQSTADALKTLIGVSSAKTISVNGDTTIVYGGTLGAPDFNIEIVPPAEKVPPEISNTVNSRIHAYRYATANDIADAKNSAYTTSATLGTTIPADLLPEADGSATGVPLYLYVCDDVGNLSITKLGNTNWLKDSIAPTITTWTSGTDHTNPSNSYIKQVDASGTMSITIAASTQAFKDAKRDSQPYTVYIPKAWFTDNGGSGVYGIGFDEDNASTASTTIATSNGVECFALEVPASKYNTGGTYNYYVYDKVYNYKEYSLSLDADDTAPTVGVKFSVTAADARLHSDDLYTSYAGTVMAKNPLGTTTGYAGTNSEAYTLKTHEVQAEKTLWTNTAATDAVTLEVEATDTNGISLITVNGTAYSAPVSVPLTATTTKTLYEIAVTDRAGNTMTHKVNLQLDNTAPTVSSATVTPNDGARTKTASGTATLYFNEITLNAEISDGSGVGLGAYRFGSEDFATTTGSISKNYADGTAIADEKITLTAHDILGNQKQNDSWTVAGTSPAVSATKFVYDNTVPAISSVVGKRDGVEAAAGSMFTVSNTDSTWAFTVTSAADCSIEIAPTWTDTSDIYKYIVTTSNTKPSVADFNSGNAPDTSVTYTASPNAGKDIKFGTAFTRYLFAIDYAGNISEATTITVAYNDVAPKYTSATFGNIHSGTPNVYSPTIGYMELTYETQSGGALTGYAFYSDASGTTPIGTAQAVASATSPINVFLPEYANETATFDIYIRLKCAIGESALTKLDGTWKMDKTKPAAPTVSGVQDSTGASLEGKGYHYESATGKLYYKTATESYLNFNLTDGATKLVTNSTYTNFTPIATIDNPAPIKTLIADGGSTTFYAVDNAFNPSATGATVNYVQDTDEPTISVVAVATVETPASGRYLNSTADDAYDFNAAKTDSSYNVRQIKFTVTASDNSDGSGIASYKYQWQGKTAVEKKVSDGSANVYTLTLDESNSDYTATKTMTITAIDYVGNESLVKVITFNPDFTAPTISVDTFKNGTDPIEDTLENICIVRNAAWGATDTWRTASGGTVYFNRNELAPTVTFKTNDAAATLTTTGSITASSDGTSTVKATATDEVGNQSEFTITFIADGTPPELTHTGFYKNAAKDSLEAEYISPVIAAGTATYYYNSNGTRKALPVFTASDGGADLKGVYIRSGSTDTTLDKNGPDYYYTATSYGVEQTFVAVDKVGNETVIAFTTVQDASAPTISSAGPATSSYIKQDATDTKKYYFNAGKTGSIYNVSSIALTVTADDEVGGTELSGIASYKYQWQGKTAVEKKVSDGSANEYTINSSDMDYENEKTMTITATDKVGNVCAEYVVTFVPIKPPVIKVDTFKSGGTDYAGSTTYISSSSDWKNESGGVVYFNADIISNPEIEFSYTAATGIGIDTSSVKYRIDGSEVSGISATDGKTTSVTATATDTVGNSSTFTVTFIADKTAPTLTPTTNIDSKYLSEEISNTGSVYFNSLKVTSPTISFTADDGTNTSGVDGSVAVTYSGASTTAISATDSNVTTVTATVKDKVGNSATYTITFTADGTKPTVTPTLTVTGGTAGNGYYDDGNETNRKVYYNGSVTAFTVTLGATDDDSDIASYACNDTNFTQGTGTDINKFTSTSSFTGGDVKFTVTDNVGNAAEKTITFTKDVSAPTITAKFMNDTTEVTLPSSYVSGTIANNGSVYFNSNEISESTAKVEFTADDTTSGSGVNGPETATESVISGTEISRTFKDKVGNSATYTVTFTADGVGPTGSATITSTTAVVTVGGVTTTYYKPGDVTFDVSSVVDAISDLVVFKYSTNGGTTKTDAAPASNIITLSLTGNQSVNIYAYDRVGNESTVGTFTLAADGDAPTISNITASGNTSDAYSYNSGTLYFDSSANTNITISLLANDVGSGVATVSDGTNNFTESSGTYSLSISAPSTSTTLSLVATDKVGNPSAGDSITLTPEVPSTYGFTAPTLTISTPPTFYNGLKSITLTTTDIDTANKDSVTVAGQTTTNTLDGNDLTLTFDSAVTGDVEITLPAEVTAVTAVKVTDGNDKERTITNAVAGASMFSRARAAVVGAADVVATGVKKIGTGVANSVKSLFGISSKPTMAETAINNAATAISNASSATVSEIATAQNAIAIPETQNALNDSYEIPATATASEASATVTVPNIKKESVVRTLTYSTEEELSPTASVSEATASVSASSTETEPATAHRSLLTVIVLLLTAILASVVAFSAIFLLKKK